MKRLPSTLADFPRRGRLFLGASAIALLGLAWAGAAAASAPIYKCLDRNLGVLYTDLPCKDGERLDVRAGDADPVAIARLERERDALARSTAQRIADDNRAALLRRYAPDPVYAANYDDTAFADAASYAPYGGYGYLAYAPALRHRSPDARSERRSTRQSVVPGRSRIPAR
jgi:hypothetical protein